MCSLSLIGSVRSETAIGDAAVSIPYAAVELARQIFGTLDDKRVLLLGAGKMSELSARGLINNGARSVEVINRTLEHAAELAAKLGGTAIAFEERWQHLVDADIVISSTSCPHVILGREEAERIASERNHRPLLIVDIALPRDIDAAVRDIKGIILHDIDDLQKVVNHNTGERETAAAEAQKIVLAEAEDFRRKLQSERVVPTIVALRNRLDEICRQELESFRLEYGPFSKDQEQMYVAVTSRITQKISGSLARELKDLPEKVEQDQMTIAVRRLFHLETPQAALAGTRN